MLGPSREIPRAVRLLKGDDSVAIAEVGPVCVVIWRGAVTEAPFELQRAALARVVDRNPGTAGMLCIVENSAKPPGDKLRSASTDMITRHGTNLKCLGCVIEGTGFMTAVHRGALAGMVLLLRNKKTSVSIFATAKEGVQWLGNQVEIPSVSDFEASIEYLRSTLPPRSQNPSSR